MKNRSTINLVTDASMFICMMAIFGIGLLMKYVLIPGKDRIVEYGRNVELFVLDMDRHDWGTIHLVIGLVFLGLLSLHIFLHWKAILGMYKRLIGDPKKRKIFATIFIATSFILVIFAFTVVPRVEELERGEGRFGIGRNIDDPIQIMGYMTLNQITEEYDIPIDYLKERLGIQQYLSGREKLGWLRRRYGTKMSEIERIVNEYCRSHQ
jgi:hypothetical protein